MPNAVFTAFIKSLIFAPLAIQFLILAYTFLNVTTILPIPDLIFVARALATLLIFDTDHAFITAKTLESPTLNLDFPILLPSNIASSFFHPFLKVNPKIPIVIIPETGSSFV